MEYHMKSTYRYSHPLSDGDLQLREHHLWWGGEMGPAGSGTLRPFGCAGSATGGGLGGGGGTTAAILDGKYSAKR